MKNLLKVAVFVLSVFIVVACGSKQSTPEKTAEAATVAIINGDTDTLIALMDTAELKEIGMDQVKPKLDQMVKGASEQMKSAGVTSDMIDITDVKYSDDKNSASLKVNYTNSNHSADPLNLKKIDNKWYIELK